ncbi:senecionine N-oxygenase-like [Sabethes cyaneus]|uniref:senecionine N-oxygenase-like n=1 Tax=Sabethes cyaneus TaxID=53552 RepID=UPI00237DB049|nr:senecionine N-oxygenase-like [Sabethes cyaneus]
MDPRRPKYCIIGAGAGGLTSARHAADTGAEVMVFEQTNQIGGTWVYTDQTGRDANGVPIHTSMYRGLRSNIPKQTMGFPDSDIQSEFSYVRQEEVLKWLLDYADEHKIWESIRLEHQVVRVCPQSGGDRQWEVIVKDLRDEKFETIEFDFVMVCNGHYSHPKIPEYPGKADFGGVQMHSHDYRCAESFKGEDILLVGAGYSASDIAIATSKVANSVTVSHYKTQNASFTPSVQVKPAIARLTPTGIVFEDNSELKCSVIIYCTGYQYSFPFLSLDCGIYVEENHVQPLYKHLINIKYPSMALLGIPFYVCPTQMMDLQARFCVQFFTGRKTFPSGEEMLNDTAADVEERRRRGLQKKSMHKLEGDLQIRYYEDLAQTAGIEPLKPIVMKLFEECMRRRAEDLLHYRDDIFEVINDEHFRTVSC